MQQRCISHVDMDAFYVSVELARHPELRGRPVVVAGSSARAVVTAASYEARGYGVFSATPAERARRLCPAAVFIEPDFEHYRERSRELMNLFATHVERVEAASLDEAYLDLSGLERPRAAARKLKAAVAAQTGLTCSVGIGPNKLVAKVASAADKPDGFLLLNQVEARERFSHAPCGILPGIGPKTASRLAAAEIKTLAQLQAADPDLLAQIFGLRFASDLRRLASFEDDRPVEPDRVAKSESREATFERDLQGLHELEPVVERLAKQVCQDLARHDRAGRTVGIKVRLDDFSTHTRARTLADPTADAATVGPVAVSLLRSFDPGRPVRLLGVRVAGLDDESLRGHDTATASAQNQLKLAI